jgi:hypothetical protein
MPQISVKITQISKDFNLKSKDVLDAFKDIGLDKKSGGSVDTDEFELFMQYITKSRQIKDLDAYRDGRAKITTPKAENPKAEKPKAEKPKPEKPKAEQEVKKAEKPAPVKVEAKAEEKKPAPKAEKPAEQRPQRTYDNAKQQDNRKNSYQKYSASPTENPFAKKIDNMNMKAQGIKGPNAKPQQPAQKPEVKKPEVQKPAAAPAAQAGSEAPPWRR